MSTTANTPKLYRLTDASAAYGFSVRQLRRWCAEGRLRRVKPSGPTGPVYLRADDLDKLVEKATIPAGKPAGRRPSKASA